MNSVVECMGMCCNEVLFDKQGLKKVLKFKKFSKTFKTL